MNEDTNRLNEWFVPKFGPTQFRIAIGILFLPYTAMCISFALLGSLLTPSIHWERIVGIIVIYFFALGIGAHFADYIGSRKRPWGIEFSKLVFMDCLGFVSLNRLCNRRLLYHFVCAFTLSRSSCRRFFPFCV